MRRIAAGAAALLSLTLAAGASPQARGREELIAEASGPSLVDSAELERLNRQRADAIRRDAEIGRDLQRLPDRQLRQGRVGGSPANWRLWNTF